MKETRILIVEDETKIAQILIDYLSNEGYKATAIHEGNSAVETICSMKPNLVILDLMLPGKDGISICKEVRKTSDVPILMLTARVEEIDRLIGLEMGADDYVCKPFLPREVVARVKAILRRVETHSKAQKDSQMLKYRDIELIPDEFRCKLGQQDIELTPVEFRILRKLLYKPGKVHSRDHLMNAAYPDERIVSGRTIDSHIKNLRKKLDTGSDDSSSIIQSIYGVGYKVE